MKSATMSSSLSNCGCQPHSWRGCLRGNQAVPHAGDAAGLGTVTIRRGQLHRLGEDAGHTGQGCQRFERGREHPDDDCLLGEGVEGSPTPFPDQVLHLSQLLRVAICEKNKGLYRRIALGVSGGDRAPEHHGDDCCQKS